MTTVRLPDSPHVRLLGMELVGFDEASETVTVSFVTPDDFITPRGAVQGGLVAGFLDEAMGWAYLHATKGAEVPLNLEISMSLIRPVPRGKLIGTSRVIRRGKRVGFLEAELFDEAGTLLARATSTAIPTPLPDA